MVIVGNKVKKNIKEFVGKVVSDKMDKTRVIEVFAVHMHPIYKKRYVVRKKYYAHDETNQTKVGDVVRIREHRPISKLKRWIIIDVVEKANK